MPSYAWPQLCLLEQLVVDELFVQKRAREAGVALKVVSMEELKLEVLLEAERSGETVTEVCRRRAISRASYYRYRRRYLE